MSTIRWRGVTRVDAAPPTPSGQAARLGRPTGSIVAGALTCGLRTPLHQDGKQTQRRRTISQQRRRLRRLRLSGAW